MRSLNSCQSCAGLIGLQCAMARMALTALLVVGVAMALSTAAGVSAYELTCSVDVMGAFTSQAESALWEKVADKFEDFRFEVVIEGSREDDAPPINIIFTSLVGLSLKVQWT